jgi:hypothetical protein
MPPLGSQVVILPSRGWPEEPVVWHYLHGTAFKQRVEAVLETFSAMSATLNKEKKAMTRIWAEGDANKAGSGQHHRHARRLARLGGWLHADNSVLGASIA